VKNNLSPSDSTDCSVHPCTHTRFLACTTCTFINSFQENADVSYMSGHRPQVKTPAINKPYLPQPANWHYTLHNTNHLTIVDVT